MMNGVAFRKAGLLTPTGISCGICVATTKVAISDRRSV